MEMTLTYRPCRVARGLVRLVVFGPGIFFANPWGPSERIQGMFLSLWWFPGRTAWGRQNTRRLF